MTRIAIFKTGKRALAARRAGPMDVAVVWNAPGAGDTGFLADFFTTRGGAAAP